MELNQTKSRTRKTVINPEGSIVLDRLPEIQLYLSASNLKIKEDSFYTEAETQLKEFIELAKTCDEKFVYGLAMFLSDNGIKLSPVVLMAVLSNKGFSFRETEAYKVFNTPQRIAEAVALGKTLHLNNSFKKNVLKVALQNMNDFTLRKNKMNRRKVKLKDLIKLLRPKPSDDNKTKLYKDIIEDGLLSKMKETETFVRVKSSKDITTDEKIKYLKDNVDKIPLNELIRNLRFITDNCDFEKEYEIGSKVIKRLKSIDNFKFLNIFDLIETAISVPQLEKICYEVVKDFVDKTRVKFNYNENCSVLFDASGSMGGDGMKNGFKYFVLVSMIFDDVKFRFFGNELWEESKSAGIVELVKKGRLSEAYKQFDCPDGTALLDSTKELLTEDLEIKNLVIISDEVSWIEGSDLSYEINEISNLTQARGINVILINPKVYKGTVFKNNLIAFASLTSAVLYNVFIKTDQNAFIRYIKEY